MRGLFGDHAGAIEDGQQLFSKLVHHLPHANLVGGVHRIAVLAHVRQVPIQSRQMVFDPRTRIGTSALEVTSEFPGVAERPVPRVTHLQRMVRRQVIAVIPLRTGGVITRYMEMRFELISLEPPDCPRAPASL